MARAIPVLAWTLTLFFALLAAFNIDRIGGKGVAHQIDVIILLLATFIGTVAIDRMGRLLGNSPNEK